MAIAGTRLAAHCSRKKIDGNEPAHRWHAMKAMLEKRRKIKTTKKISKQKKLSFHVAR